MGKIDELRREGVSVWLDDLSRERLNTGNLQHLVDTAGVVGVTTNPAIFQAAISAGLGYSDAIAQLASQGKNVEEVILQLTTDDVRQACDVFAQIYAESGGVDGRVSIEVDPRLARKGEQTFIQAQKLWQIVDRPNLMIKIPATKEGLPAITRAIAHGISVNVTLIFSERRYREVAHAYIAGLKQAHEAGLDLSKIHSVASFFISRVDSEIDAQLEAMGSPDALAMRGRAGLANARVAYGAFMEIFEESEEFRELRELGANVQRPLWASTGVKNPNYSPTLYVDQLVSTNVVNTMPEATLHATIEEANITGDTIRDSIYSAQRTIEKIIRLGVDFDQAMIKLKNDGVEKFEIAWNELIETVEKAMR
ncbi:transaldolase [Arcanobacterium pluranimalium]|uniref:transaldolase n=1 Tax=Arcanobacterium pluranimalium TaxID=108028 RepID=UPI00195CB847|nr:transaldolase [Arcanobacterium pluranimalium]MBM7825401.1 transaldolase [Arcanobacterium pluranimalium]